MFDFLTTPFANGPSVHPLELAIRLLTALAFGWGIAFVYQKTRKSPDSSFTSTILLLCVLIAMVTQVIGDNVARAFSLVGALSIVRFRTVVRDTQDTAYVILAVIVGMAVGAKALWVALIGIAVVGLAELLLNWRKGNALAPQFAFVVGGKPVGNGIAHAFPHAATGKHQDGRDRAAETQALGNTHHGVAAAPAAGGMATAPGAGTGAGGGTLPKSRTWST